MRLRNGTASHSSSVSRPGKLRLPKWCLPRCNGPSFVPSSLPTIVGRGDRALARWVGRRVQRSFGDDNEASSQTPPPPRFAWSPSPAFAGADKLPHSRDAPAHPSFATALQESPSHGLPKKGGGAPKGATFIGPCHAFGCCHPAALSGAAAALSEAARLPALHRGLAGVLPPAQPRPRFTRSRNTGVTRAANRA
jgi:hypothetical protein